MTSAFLIADIKLDEGYRLKPYRDSRGFWTGGYGELLSRTDTYDPKFDAYTKADWESALDASILKAKISLNAKLPWWVQLSDFRQDVMVNLSFNLGIGELATWKHFLGYAQRGFYIMAGQELRNTEPWATQVGARALRLANQMTMNIHV